jgi:hypothetical protein
MKPAPHIVAARKDKSKRLLNKYLSARPTDWTAADMLVQSVCQASLPDSYKTGLVSYQRITQWTQAWINGDFDTEVNPPQPDKTPAVNRLQALLSQPAPPLDPKEPVNSFGDMVLYPEQWDTFKRLRADILSNNFSGGLQNGNTGSGKTFLAVALMYEFGVRLKIHENGLVNRLRQTPFLIITRKTLLSQWREVAFMAGLGDLIKSGKLLIIPYSHLSSSKSARWYTTEYDSFEDKYVYEWLPQSLPILTIIDECQGLCNPTTKQTLAMDALIQKARNANMQAMTLSMSATPFDTVSKAGWVVSSIRKPLVHEGVTFNCKSVLQWPQYATLFADDPTKSNQAAMKRLRDCIDPYIYEIENVRWPARARNRSLVVDFESPEHRTRYNKAYEDYLERIAKLGRAASDSPFQQFVAINAFSKAVEPMRNYANLQRVVSNMNNKIATAIGCRFKHTITDMVFRLEAAGIKRHEISIIWGGGADYDEDNTFSEAQLSDLIKKLQSGDKLSRATISKMRKTLTFREELITSGDSEQERYARYDVLRELGMTGSQSSDKRWSEIQKFQRGISKVCLFTISAGGAGLSLDRNKPELWPRELLGSLCWDGKDFKQLLGRLVRRGTLPGYVDQYITYMRDTVEDTKFLPVVERKLANLREIGARGIDPTEIMMSEGRITHERLSIEQLNAIADSDESQITGDVEDDDDEEDGDE